MKHSEGHYFRGGSWISVSLLLLSLSNLSWSRLPSPLPTSIRILGIFDKGGDPKHIMGFKAAIDKINAKQDINQENKKAKSWKIDQTALRSKDQQCSIR